MNAKNILTLGAMAVGMTLASCDYTDLSPLDSFTDKTYWRTTNDLKLYANDLYNGMLAGPTAGGDATSDNFVTSSYSGYLFNEYVVPPSGGGWSWGAVRECNYFLKRYDKVQGQEEEINKYVAEVRFFRAQEYYGKIRTFGDVPWYDTDLQTNDQELLYKPRDSRNFVLGKIIEDLEFAIKWLPEKSSAEKGRLNKDAARTQLARVCLYYGTYMKYHHEADAEGISSVALLKRAVALTDEIINSGNYDIVKGSDAGAGTKAYDGYPLYYANQFVQEDLSNNKEGILCRYYQNGVLTHETGRQAGGNGMGLSKDFIESFLMKDGTPIHNTGSGYAGDDNMENELKNRDPRLYQLIDNNHKPYLIRNNVQTQNVVADCSSSGGITGYPCTKFHSADESQSQARNTSYDWFIYRYAEVLLMNAEANAELGTCTQAVLDKTINKLRDRVEMAHLTVNPVADQHPLDYGYPVSPLLYEIRRERRIELVGEGFRMDDLKRWNAMKLLENPMTMFGLRITPEVEAMYKKANVTFGGKDGRPIVEYTNPATGIRSKYLYQYAASKSLDDAGRKWTEKDRRWLLPLPIDQLTLNPKLTQNPGWTK